jgi:hypothetical protein
MDENPKRITQGRYVAEILQSRNTTDTETFWYYVLHRDGLPEVIDLKKFSTYDQAMEGAKNVLAGMNRAASAAE